MATYITDADFTVRTYIFLQLDSGMLFPTSTDVLKGHPDYAYIGYYDVPIREVTTETK